MGAQEPSNQERQPEDDLDLLRSYRDEHDEQAFAELVQRHVNLVFGIAYRSLRDWQMSEDVSQRVFTAFARKGRRQTIRHISSWLYGATQREVNSMIRSESRRQSREREAHEREMLAQAAANPESLEAMSDVVWSSLKRLSLKDQQALFLRFYEGQEFREIGAALGVELRAAQKRVYRAMESLRSELRKRGITATGAVFSSQLFTAGAVSSPPGLASTLSEKALTATTGTTSLAAVLTNIRLPASYVPGVVALVVTVTAGALVWGPLNVWRPKDGTFAPSSGAKSTSTLLERRGMAAADRLAVDDIEGIYRLAAQLRERALLRLMDHLSQPREEDYLRDLFTRWSRLDSPRNAAAIVELARRLHDQEEMFVDLLQIPLAVWWRTDAVAMERWIGGLPRSDRGERVAFGAAVRVISFEDPRRAFVLIGARAGTGESHYEVLAEAMAQHGFEQTLSWLKEFPEPSKATVVSNMDARVRFEDEVDVPIRRLYAALLPHFFEWDRQATADWVMESDVRELTDRFVERWAGLEAERAAEWVLDLPREERESALVALTVRWAKDDPDAAMAWMAKQSLASEAAPAFGCMAGAVGPERALEWAQ